MFFLSKILRINKNQNYLQINYYIRFYNNIIHSEIINIKKSKFQSHLCNIYNKNDIDNFIIELKKDKRINKATHNILAYRYYDENKVIIEGYDDDGEIGAGKRLLFLV